MKNSQLILVGMLIFFNLPAFSQIDEARIAIAAGRNKDAFGLLINAASQGNPEAQRLVGEMYFEGKGVSKDIAKSLVWSKASADRGDRLAQYTMGYFNENGIGAPTSAANALSYYRLSALQGFIPAKVKLADMYWAAGDRGLAGNWYREAAIDGNERAIKRIKEIGDSLDVEHALRDKEDRERENRENAVEAREYARRMEVMRAEEEADARSSRLNLARDLAAQQQKFAQNAARINSIGRSVDNSKISDRGDSKGLFVNNINRPPERQDSNSFSIAAKPNQQENNQDIVEHNPYDKFPKSESWGNTLAPWMAYKGFAESRSGSCKQAIDRMEAAINRDVGSGFAVVKDRTDCVCQTTPRSNGLLKTVKGWQCAVYWSLTDTGKKRGVVAR